MMWYGVRLKVLGRTHKRIVLRRRWGIPTDYSQNTLGIGLVGTRHYQSGEIISVCLDTKEGNVP